MLQILNPSSLALDLYADTTIPIERNNALFNDPDKFVQDVTYSGKAPLTPNNINLIKNGHLVEADRGVYEQNGWRLVYFGETFFAGIFSYKIVNNEIEFIFKVNFGTVADKMKRASVREIISMDQNYNIPNLQAMMKDTCVNPLNYDCVFFPVWNDRWYDDGSEVTYKMINYWDHGAQTFKVVDGVGPTFTTQVPFFRLTYLLKKLLEYLNFNVTGGAFDDPIEQNIYVYSRRALIGAKILPSLQYLPVMQLNDLLKQVVQRRRYSMDFDVVTNTVSVETPKSVLEKSDYIDISEYVDSIQEITPPVQKGYKVTLKLDESDPAWNTSKTDTPEYKPPYILSVGDGQNEVVMDIGTLKLREDPTANLPMNQQPVGYTQTEGIDTWPLTLLEYSGMKSVADAKVFPQAKPLDLTLNDSRWWSFLNSSKPLVIIANIPASIVQKMKPKIKIGFKSKEGNFSLALPKKISYDLKNNNPELIRVKIEAQTMDVGNDTSVFIDNVDPEQIDARSIAKYKGYWDPVKMNFDSFYVERIYVSGTAATYAYTPVTSPTDDHGVGGTIGTSYTVTGDRTSGHQNRLHAPVPPKYYVAGGVVGYFQAVADYYIFLPLPAGSNVPTASFIWVVF